MSDVILTIDGQSVTTASGTTILKAAQQIGVAIPTMCYHDYCTANALCRVCVVEVQGARTLVPACVGAVSEGMIVNTRSERVLRARRTILELLDSAVDLSEAPDIQALLAEYRVDRRRFPEARRREFPVLDDNPMYVRDYAKCILCWRCVQVCAEDAQYTFALDFAKRGFETHIATFWDKPMPETTCVFCGQCVGVCPTNALKPKREWLIEQGCSPQETMALTKSEKRKTRK